MGTCKTPCCFQQEKQTFIAVDGNSSDATKNENSNAQKSSHECGYKNDDNIITSTATSLFKPDIYEKMTNGSKLENIVAAEIKNFDIDLHFGITEFIFETICKITVSEQIAAELIKFCKISLKKPLMDLHSLSPFSSFTTYSKISFDRVIANLTEIFHYIKLHILKKIVPYNKNYWTVKDDIARYMRLKILNTCEHLSGIKKMIETKESIACDESTTLAKMKSTDKFLNKIFHGSVKGR